MIATRNETASDADLVEAVRAGDDSAFEELYGRYRARITSFVRGMLRDEGRAEDVAQEAFLAALRRLRETDSEIAFKPWIYQIARNAAIDSHRRRSRAEEVSMDAETGLRASDRLRLVDSAAPESVLVDKERLDHLRGAFDELSDVHTRVLVMRELEGMSYREIGKRLELTRPAVESALFRARRRLESEYEELSEGRRCAAMRTTIARLAGGGAGERDQLRLGRHARRCSLCRRRAREFGVEPALGRGRAAALLPLPSVAQIGAFVSEKAAALLAIVAVAGAGGAALTIESQRGDGGQPPAHERLLQERDVPARGHDAPASPGSSSPRVPERLERRLRQGRRRDGAPARERLRGDRGAGAGSGAATGSGSAPAADGAAGEDGISGATDGVRNTLDNVGSPVDTALGGAGGAVENALPETPELPSVPVEAPSLPLPEEPVDLRGVVEDVPGALP